MQRINENDDYLDQDIHHGLVKMSHVNSAQELKNIPDPKVARNQSQMVTRTNVSQASKI